MGPPPADTSASSADTSPRKSAFVSGGSGGIGRACVQLLAAQGHDVAFSYLSNEAAAQDLAQAVQACGAGALPIQLDLTDAPATAAALAQAAERLGGSGVDGSGVGGSATSGIDVLVHAGGPFVPQEYVAQISPEQFHQQCQQDIAGFFNLLSGAAEHLRKTQGALVAVTTCAVRRFPKRDVLSSAPKAAVEALVKAFAREEGRYGVRANCVGPGMLTDGMAAELMSSGAIDEAAQNAARSNIALGTFGTAQDVAEAVCFLASDKARYITGQTLDVDGGFSI